MSKRLIWLASFGLVLGLAPSVLAALPPGWAAQEIANPVMAMPGTANEADGVFTLTASGDDIWGTNDEFEYVYLPLRGDGEISARVVSVTGGNNEWRKAGVMIRETLTDTSKHIHMLLSHPDYTHGSHWAHVLALQFRPTTGGSSSSDDAVPSGYAGMPYWIKLVRQDNFFTAYRSPDGVTWTRFSSAIVDMGKDVYIGLSLTSHNRTQLTIATFDNVTVLRPQQGMAISPNPADGSAVEADSVVLTWSPGPYAASHDVYFSDNFDDVNTATSSDPMGSDKVYKARQTELKYPPGDWDTIPLTRGETYYWRVDEVNGVDTWRGEIWSFTVAANLNWNPSPPHQATHVPVTTDLSWSKGALALVGHIIYLSTDFSAVNDAVPATTNGPAYLGSTSSPTATSIVIPGDLLYGTTYYWRADAVEKNAPLTVHKGEVWQFEIPTTDPTLIGWWTFDEGGGETVVDRSGYGNHGAIVGGAQRAPGQIREAINLNGNGQNVAIPNFDEIIGAGGAGLPEISIAMWARPDTVSGRRTMWFTVMTVCRINGGNWEFTRATSGNSVDAIGPAAVAGEWAHYVGVGKNNDALYVYINGEIGGSAAFIRAGDYSTENPDASWIGCQEGAQYYFGGLIDDVRVYNRALSQAEVQALTVRYEATNRSPAHGNMVDADAVVLTWTPGTYAVLHDVYFSDNFDDVNTATTSSGVVYKGRQSELKYPPGPFDTIPVTWGETYYWRIDEVNGVNVWRGDIWSFTTLTGGVPPLPEIPYEVGDRWDLKYNFSETANPNGVWSYLNRDFTLLGAGSWFGQFAWRIDGECIMKANSHCVGGFDVLFGDVFGTEINVYQWTSPIYGSVKVSGNCWRAGNTTDNPDRAILVRDAAWAASTSIELGLVLGTRYNLSSFEQTFEVVPSQKVQLRLWRDPGLGSSQWSGANLRIEILSLYHNWQDCNGNGIPDEYDIAAGTSHDVNGDGVPDECQIDARVVPVVTLIDPASTTEVRTTLPDSIEAVVRGGKYYLEVWVSDTGTTRTGLTGVYVDVSFCGQTSASAVEHGTVFTMFTDGDIQPGGVDEFGGSALPHGGGIEPEWVRVGWIEMSADIDSPTCSISLLPSTGGVAAYGQGLVPWAFIDLGAVDLQILPPARSYNLDGDSVIGVGDLSLFAPSWQRSVPPAQNAHDFDCDCFVGVGDLSWFATGWSKSPADPTILYPPCPGGGSCGEAASMRGMAPRGFTLTSLRPMAKMSSGPVDVDVAFELVVLNAPSASGTTTLLPTSIGSIAQGQTYYVEVWVSDVGDISTGITSAYVDLHFPAAAASVTNVSHGNLFTLFPSGSVASGVIDELGGSQLSPGVGVAPQWARVAVIRMRADAALPSVTFSLSPSSTGVAAWGRGVVDWDDIYLGSASVPPKITGFVRTPRAAGLDGVLLFADNGGGSGLTNAAGYYELVVPQGWSGTVTPGSIEFSLSFDPDVLSYSNVTNILSNQDYTARNICDLNDDDGVTIVDFAYFADYWLQSGAELPANFDLSDPIGYPDLEIFVNNWLWTP